MTDDPGVVFTSVPLARRVDVIDSRRLVSGECICCDAHESPHAVTDRFRSRYHVARPRWRRFCHFQSSFIYVYYTYKIAHLLAEM